MSEKDSDQNVVLLPSEKEVSQFLPNEVLILYIKKKFNLHFQSKQQWRIPHLRYFIVIIGTLSASIGQFWEFLDKLSIWFKEFHVVLRTISPLSVE